ncbi:polysaccharide deacetylase family protein [Vulgatibacter sp.]|uniref:polysaccharide deacetylase family protein n=1 Tax=Vulgatibacter sp. TaxID=1971226 RepID=UPI0035680F13
MGEWDSSKTPRAVIRRTIKAAAATALEGTGARRLLSAVRRRNVGGVRVQFIAWHRIVPDFEGMRGKVIPGLLTSTRTFDRQLAWLGQNYRFATIPEALEVLSGNRRSDRDLCVLTFDDGYADFLEHAVPILRKHRAPGIIYVPTGFVETGIPLLHDRLYRVLRLAAQRNLAVREIGGGPLVTAALEDALRGDVIWALERLLETRPRELCLQVAQALESCLEVDPAETLVDSSLLTWEELRAVRAAGFEVGAHTVDHACLPNESAAEVERQLRLSRETFREKLGEDVLDFAYPNGWYSRGAIRALIRGGYRSAVTTEDRPNRLGEDPYTLKRKCVWEFTSRGLGGFSAAVNACNFDDTLGQLGISSWVHGERPDAVGTVGASRGEEAGGAPSERAASSGSA